VAAQAPAIDIPYIRYCDALHLHYGKKSRKFRKKYIPKMVSGPTYRSHSSWPNQVQDQICRECAHPHRSRRLLLMWNGSKTLTTKMDILSRVVVVACQKQNPQQRKQKGISLMVMINSMEDIRKDSHFGKSWTFNARNLWNFSWGCDKFLNVNITRKRGRGFQYLMQELAQEATSGGIGSGKL